MTLRIVSTFCTTGLVLLLGVEPAAAQPLKANERVQGTIVVDIGQGPVQMRSLATTMDADLGQQAAARLGTAQGQKDLAQAKAQIGGKAAEKVTAGDVQATADFFAGKTLYASQARRLDIVKQYIVSLSATSADGSSTQLNLSLAQANLALASANVRYKPRGARVTDEFESAKSGPGAAVVQIDKVERVGDKGFVLSGSFRAADLKPGVLAKNLKDQTLPSLSGRFSFTELPLR